MGVHERFPPEHPCAHARINPIAPCTSSGTPPAVLPTAPISYVADSQPTSLCSLHHVCLCFRFSGHMAFRLVRLLAGSQLPQCNTSYLPFSTHSETNSKIRLVFRTANMRFTSQSQSRTTSRQCLPIPANRPHTTHPAQSHPPSELPELQLLLPPKHVHLLAFIQLPSRHWHHSRNSSVNVSMRLPELKPPGTDRHPQRYLLYW